MSQSVELMAFRLTRVPPEKSPCARTVIQEAPLVIHVDGGSDYSLMRTPGQDRELAVGFLFTEGLIESVRDIHMLQVCEDTPNLIKVVTAKPVSRNADRAQMVSSSCGLCGRTDIPALLAGLNPVGEGLRVAAETLFTVPERIRNLQELFKLTGATHAAALFETDGTLIVAREDVGRHCALDKVIGHALLHGQPMDRCGVFLSGRASLEMIIKVVRAGIQLVVAVSAPTGASVEAARRLGVTLCGFARSDAATIYSRDDRIE